MAKCRPLFLGLVLESLLVDTNPSLSCIPVSLASTSWWGTLGAEGCPVHIHEEMLNFLKPLNTCTRIPSLTEITARFLHMYLKGELYYNLHAVTIGPLRQVSRGHLFSVSLQYKFMCACMCIPLPLKFNKDFFNNNYVDPKVIATPPSVLSTFNHADSLRDNLVLWLPKKLCFMLQLPSGLEDWLIPSGKCSFHLCRGAYFKHHYSMRTSGFFYKMLTAGVCKPNSLALSIDCCSTQCAMYYFTAF